MNSIRVNILNPKAVRLLEDLADLKLISIQDTSKNRFAEVLQKLRSKSKNTPSIEEIAKEVAFVRKKR